jgi:hypothetical protein
MPNAAGRLKQVGNAAGGANPARAVQRCENGLICADHVVLIDGKQVWVIRGILNRF